MLIKDQLRIRMDQLGISVVELARSLEVSAQTVRHWLNGRSFPGKSKVPALESALSLKLDFSQGLQQGATVVDTLQQTDIETFLYISRLPPDVKGIFSSLARAFVVAQEGPSKSFSQRAVEPSALPFSEKQQGEKNAIKRSPGRPARKAARTS